MEMEISEDEQRRYHELFVAYVTPGSNILYGGQAKPIFESSGLRPDQLEKIWDISDIDSNGGLDFEEFCVAMRLIFDTINNVYSDVPDQLPEWMFPATKARFAGKRLVGKKASKPIEPQNATKTSSQPSHNDENDENLSDNFDWYMAPDDRKRYESIYTTHKDFHGAIRYNDLSGLYDTLSIPEFEIKRAWRLVNPDEEVLIGKDQSLAFMHILNNRQNGYKIPVAIPPSLRTSFHKSRIDFRSVSNLSGSTSAATKRSEFAQSYLDRMGIGSSSHKITGTDFSNKNPNAWKDDNDNMKKSDITNNSGVVRRELELLLDYKRKELRRLEEQVGKSGINGNKESDNELSSLRASLDSLKARLEDFEDYYKRRKEEYQELLSQIDKEKQ